MRGKSEPAGAQETENLPRQVSVVTTEEETARARSSAESELLRRADELSARLMHAGRVRMDYFTRALKSKIRVALGREITLGLFIARRGVG